MSDDAPSTDDLIESLVRITHGASDVRTQHMYRQSLQMLVGLAKLEQSREMGLDSVSQRVHQPGIMH